MRLLLFTFSLFISLYSCQKKVEVIPERKKSPHRNFELEMRQECEADSLKAEADIKNGNLKFFVFHGLTETFSSNKEMAQLLKKHNIGMDSAMIFCTDVKGEMNCYPRIMQKEIYLRYGENFIDSLRTIADTMYVKNHPNRVFGYRECETSPRYLGYKKHNNFINSDAPSYEIDFFKIVPFPKDFKHREDNESLSSISASFNLHKNGEISDISIFINFENQYNVRFKKYYTDKLIHFINNTRWTPAKSKGIKVNNRMAVYIPFKYDKPL